MGIRVGFLTTLNTNVGDDFVREGIRHVLDRCSVAYEPFYVNKHDPASLRNPAEDEVRVLKHKFWETDLFIQSGAPVYWHLNPHTSLTCEWHKWFWEELVLMEKPPQTPPVFLNLGAGTCQAWGDGPEAFLADAGCVAFARRVAARSRLTTVRDPLAARLLSTLNIPHRSLPCPAFLAAGRHGDRAPLAGLVGVNFMPLASHWDLKGNFDRTAWAEEIAKLVATLRRTASLLFICHDDTEVEFAQRFREPGERVFRSASWRDYFDVYAHCEVVVANRVHGAVCAAGFGVPAIVIGNDTRFEIADLINVPRFHAANLSVPEVVDAVEQYRQAGNKERERLVSLRQRSVEQYRELLEPILQEVGA